MPFLFQIVDKTIMEADKDHDGKISFEEFTKMVESTDISMSMTLVCSPSFSPRFLFASICLSVSLLVSGFGCFPSQVFHCQS